MKRSVRRFHMKRTNVVACYSFVHLAIIELHSTTFPPLLYSTLDHKIIIMRNHTMNPSSSILHDIQTYDLKSNELSSGTTIMALSTGDAVILGADSRVSTGTYVANRVSDKIAQLSPHIYCCRSGSAADTQFLTDIVKHYLSQLTYVRFHFFLRKLIIFLCCCGVCAVWTEFFQLTD
jgi:hypothetical protein